MYNLDELIQIFEDLVLSMIANEVNQTLVNIIHRQNLTYIHSANLQQVWVGANVTIVQKFQKRLVIDTA